jgi:hypothetical protein
MYSGRPAVNRIPRSACVSRNRHSSSVVEPTGDVVFAEELVPSLVCEKPLRFESNIDACRQADPINSRFRRLGDPTGPGSRCTCNAMKESP